ncbi:unnamed protein product [Peronospora belbahrii]|uniref:Uncharacterized protein n=1 Tax=Peronospora belbahrii TaxID=622444 RepID=A0ABN8CVR5_9STRA|nr:unnamed protein product [Peronospora belbahrii]
MSTVVCHFERRGCFHPALFQSKYKRTNRTKKTKILRCFPHCCPEHLNRSYCGSALYVSVQLINPSNLNAQQQTTCTTVNTINPAKLLVFARFEEALTNFLSLNDVLDYNDVIGFTQTNETPKGTWIEGFVMSKTTNDSSMFQINPSAHWYYEWESAATKVQRFTKHALRVYIFQQVQSQLRVVGTVSSSDFMVVSYRRAPSGVRAEREALEMLRAVASIQSGGSVDSYETSSVHAAILPERKSSSSHSLQITESEEGLWRNRKLWECQHTDVMTSSKQLAILYYFLRHLNALSFPTCLDQLSVLFSDQIAGFYAVIGKKWKEDSGIEPPVGPPLSWAFLKSLNQVENDKGRFDDTSEAVEGGRNSLKRLVQMCMNLVGWLALDSSNLEIYRRFFQSHGEVLLDKNRVRDGYVEAVKLIGKLIDRFTGWSENPSSTSSTWLSLLCEEIMVVVFTYDYLKPLRRILTDVLMSNKMFGMHQFVAQIRAQYLLKNCRTTLSMLAWTVENQVSAFDGTWVFDGQRSSLMPIPGSTQHEVSLWCVLTFMREFARVNIRPLDDQSLEICSDWNVCSFATGTLKMKINNRFGMSLMLDSRQRVFSSFPSGISSSSPLGTHSYGDYRGNVTSPNSFVLEISSWPIDRTYPALRCKMQVYTETGSGAQGAESNRGCLVVKALVEEGCWRKDDNNHRDPDFPTIPFSLKQKLVETWYPIYKLIGVYLRVD